MTEVTKTVHIPVQVLWSENIPNLGMGNRKKRPAQWLNLYNECRTSLQEVRNRTWSWHHFGLQGVVEYFQRITIRHCSCKHNKEFFFWLYQWHVKIYFTISVYSIYIYLYMIISYIHSLHDNHNAWGTIGENVIYYKMWKN